MTRVAFGAEPGGVLQAIGDTPLVRLNRLVDPSGPQVWAKLEMLNPGGSAKDRPALRMLSAALASGRLRTGDRVVESSSGHMGIGLAQACAVLGLQLVCVVDHRAQAQNLAILRAYGARIETVEATSPDDDLLTARLHRVREIVEGDPRAFWPNQYANLHNPAAHEHGTMKEIDEALDGQVDLVFVATSTTGTARGCAAYVASHRRSTRVIGVDAVGSALFGGRPGDRAIAGLGAGVEPPLARHAALDAVVRVDAADCVVGCRRLIRSEGILAGGSAGGVVTALERHLPRLPSGARCVVILPDRGSRYLDTVFDDGWVEERLGVSPSELRERVERPRVLESACEAVG